MSSDNDKPYTDEALTTLAKAAAKYLIACADGDKDGALAELNKARLMRHNPNARQK